LPGLLTLLADLPDVGVVPLEPAAAAAGALGRRESIASSGEALPFVTRLPDDSALAPPPPPRSGEPLPPVAPPATRAREAPSHVVYDGRAIPIDDKPLALGVAPPGVRGIRLRGRVAGVSRTHCSLVRRGGAVWVDDCSTHGTFVNGERIAGRAELRAGDRLRVGSPGIELQLIVVEVAAR